MHGSIDSSAVSSACYACNDAWFVRSMGGGLFGLSNKRGGQLVHAMIISQWMGSQCMRCWFIVGSFHKGFTFTGLQQDYKGPSAKGWLLSQGLSKQRGRQA